VTRSPNAAENRNNGTRDAGNFLLNSQLPPLVKRWLSISTVQRARSWGLDYHDEVHLLPAPIFRSRRTTVVALGLTPRWLTARKAMSSHWLSNATMSPGAKLKHRGFMAAAECSEIRAPQARSPDEYALQTNVVSSALPPKIRRNMWGRTAAATRSETHPDHNIWLTEADCGNSEITCCDRKNGTARARSPIWTISGSGATTDNLVTKVGNLPWICLMRCPDSRQVNNGSSEAQRLGEFSVPKSMVTAPTLQF